MFPLKQELRRKMLMLMLYTVLSSYGLKLNITASSTNFDTLMKKNTRTIFKISNDAFREIYNEFTFDENNEDYCY